MSMQMYQQRQQSDILVDGEIRDSLKLVEEYCPTENHDEDIREIQSAIVQQLNQNRHLNAIQQNEEVKSLLEALEPETRQKYQLWISELQELEKERVKKLKEMMLQLSPEGQQNFAKILFIQQSETLSQDQKIKRLNEVTAEMPKHVKEELSEQVKHQEVLKKFLQSRSY
uniref:Uncharacterized protein n=1 Tax=Panagrolaimus superbus TaxID=310955 RepID=A0A914YYN7_9BILA